MEFHENLHNIGAREGLKERKLQKSVESFTWNITILKVMYLPLVSYCVFPFTTDILIFLLVIILCHSLNGFIHFFNHVQFNLYNLKTQQAVNVDFSSFLLLWGLFHLVCVTFSSYNLFMLTRSAVIWNTWVKQLSVDLCWEEAMLLFKPCFVIWKGVRVLRLMLLLKNKREGVAAAVSDEWWLTIHTNYIINSDWSKLSVYELEILFAFYWVHLLTFWCHNKWWSIKIPLARDPQKTRMLNSSGFLLLVFHLNRV